MVAYYNEIDEVACAVLRHNYEGHVDGRSIKDVEPSDIRPFRRAHFFAGAGLWEVACQLAGWPVGRELWTASCPCQPFSAAGKGLGTDDPRHLWPDLFRLVDACRPACIVGEQVAGKAGDAWLDGVCADLESIGYAVRAVEVPASAVDSPQKRSRNWWVAMADTQGSGRNERPSKLGSSAARSKTARLDELVDGRDVLNSTVRNGERRRITNPGGVELYWQKKRRLDAAAGSPMASADGGRRSGWSLHTRREALGRDIAEGTDGAVEHPASDGRREGWPEHELRSGRDAAAGADLSSFWSDHDWLQCADGKARRIPRDSERGVCVLDYGMAGEPYLGRDTGHPERQIETVDYSLLVPPHKGRTDLWRLAGNSIVPHLAAQVLVAILETVDG